MPFVMNPSTLEDWATNAQATLRESRHLIGGMPPLYQDLPYVKATVRQINDVLLDYERWRGQDDNKQPERD